MAFSDENQNFFRLYYVLIKFGTEVLNELLRFLVHKTSPSATTLSRFLALPQVQSDLCPTRARGCLDPMQKELLYPSGVPSTTIDYGDLDITLVTILLKNVTVFSGLLYQPCNPAYCSRTLWTNPTKHDRLFYPLEANVASLKNKRNDIAHSKKPSLSTVDFEMDFDQVKSWVMTIMRRVGSAAFNEDDIEQYRTNPLLPEVFQETAEKLLESLGVAEELKVEVGRLIEGQAQTEDRLLHQIVKSTRKTRRLVVVSLVIAIVLVLGMLVWNKVSTDLEIEKLKESSLNTKSSVGRVQLRRETGQDLEVRKQRLRDAIKMHPFICSSWKNKDEKMKDEKMKEKNIENCIDWMLKRNVRASFHSLPEKEERLHFSLYSATKRLNNEKRFPIEHEEPVKEYRHCTLRKSFKETIRLKPFKLKSSRLDAEMKQARKKCSTTETYEMSKDEL